MKALQISIICVNGTITFIEFEARFEGKFDQCGDTINLIFLHTQWTGYYPANRYVDRAVPWTSRKDGSKTGLEDETLRDEMVETVVSWSRY